MSHGWLVRCDPAAARFEVVDLSGATCRRSAGLEIVSAGYGARPQNLVAQSHERVEGAADPRRCGRSVEARAVWDAGERTLWLVADPMGRHPLFHARVGGLRVASTDLAALLSEPGVSREPSAIAVAEWLLEVSGPPEETLLRDVERVPAGHVLRVRPDGRTLVEDWAPPPRDTHPATEADRFGDVLESAVAALSDGLTGVLLSGGIDSTAVAAATARVGGPPPLALCLDFPEESERAQQLAVCEALALERIAHTYRPTADAFRRSLGLATASLWPVQSAWADAGEELIQQALRAGCRTILDGVGGDEVLDPGLDPARAFLRRGQLGALVSLARAERRYSGATARTVLRAALRRPARSHPAPPAWVADPALRRELNDRSDGRADDVPHLDTFAAAGREATFARAAAGGFRVVEPFADPGVVELLQGLPARALTRGGEPKSPARRYLRECLPTLTGQWPRPAVVHGLLDAIMAHAPSATAPFLADLGLAPEMAELDMAERWDMLSLEGWFQRNRGTP